MCVPAELHHASPQNNVQISTHSFAHTHTHTHFPTLSERRGEGNEILCNLFHISRDNGIGLTPPIRGPPEPGYNDIVLVQGSFPGIPCQESTVLCSLQLH